MRVVNKYRTELVLKKNICWFIGKSKKETQVASVSWTSVQGGTTKNPGLEG